MNPSSSAQPAAIHDLNLMLRRHATASARMLRCGDITVTAPDGPRTGIAVRALVEAGFEVVRSSPSSTRLHPATAQARLLLGVSPELDTSIIDADWELISRLYRGSREWLVRTAMGARALRANSAREAIDKLNGIGITPTHYPIEVSGLQFPVGLIGAEEVESMLATGRAK